LPPSVIPVRLMRPPPAVAVMVSPLPWQDVISPFGVDTVNPAGRVSVKPTPVSVLPGALGFVTVKFSVVVPLSGIDAAPNVFVIVGGDSARAGHAPPMTIANPKMIRFRV